MTRLGIVTLAAALSLESLACCKNSNSDPVAEHEVELRRDLVQRIHVPSAAYAGPWLEAPLLQVIGDAAHLDGTPAARFGAKEATAELLNVLRMKREMWQQGHLGQQFPGLVLLAAERAMPGSTLAAIANAVAGAGYTKLGVVVHAVSKGPRSADSLGVVIVSVHAGSETGGVKLPDGLRLSIGPSDMAVLLRESGGIESPPEPVALTEEPGPDETVRLPGLIAAVARHGEARGGERRHVVVNGTGLLTLKKLIGIHDVFGTPTAAYDVLLSVPQSPSPE